MDALSSELSLLASLLSAPDLETKEAVLELAVHYPWLQPAAKELEQLPVNVWQAEHNRLFADRAISPAIALHGKTHFSEYPRGLPLQSLKHLYQRMGMGFADISLDYLGTLLECAAYLNANPTLGKEFWDELWHEHLACWIPGFCRELKRKSRLALYRVVADRLCLLFPEVQYLATTAA
jgi:TorA maturation chaperone TorD